MLKKSLSLLLALVMALALVPIVALAASDTADYDGHRYQRIETGMTWAEAKAYCEKLGGHLATITSEAEQKVVMELVKAGSQAQYWLGGTDEGDEGNWRWITGEPWDYWYTTVTFNNWNGNEHYLQMERHHWGDESKLGVWNDINNENYIKDEESFFSTANSGLICEFDSIASGWAQPELKKADEMGLIPDSLKKADLSKNITRAEFAAVAVKVYENLSGTKATASATNPFTDTKDPEVLKAYNVGITSGTAADKFSPDVLLNREQCATMLTRVLKRCYIPGWTLATDGNYTLNFTQPAKFADDAKISDWAKPSVYFMAANGVISGTGNNNFSPPATTTAEQEANYASATREQAIIIGVRMVEKLGGKTLDYKEGAAQEPTKPTEPTQPTDNQSIVGAWSISPKLSINEARSWIEFKSDGTFKYYNTYTRVIGYLHEETEFIRTGKYTVSGDKINCTNILETYKVDPDSNQSYENKAVPNCTWLFKFTVKPFNKGTIVYEEYVDVLFLEVNFSPYDESDLLNKYESFAKPF